jgi:hypothetical protein
MTRAARSRYLRNTHKAIGTTPAANPPPALLPAEPRWATRGGSCLPGWP